MEEKVGKQPKRRNNKQTNCRYGAECRNIGKGCKFIHPPHVTSSGDPVNTASSTTNKQNQKKTKESKRDKSKIPCRYGMDCLHSKCPYFHHPSAGVPRQVRGRAAVPSARWFLLQLLQLQLQTENRRRRLPPLQLGKLRTKRSVGGVLAAEIRNVHLPTQLLVHQHLPPPKEGKQFQKVQ